MSDMGGVFVPSEASDCLAIPTTPGTWIQETGPEVEMGVHQPITKSRSRLDVVGDNRDFEPKGNEDNIRIYSWPLGALRSGVFFY